MTLSEFKSSTQYLSPSASQAGNIWYEWAQELQEFDRTSNEDTPELSQTAEDFLGKIHGRIQMVAYQYGTAIAGKVLELSLHGCCLFPWELLSAGAEFSKGADYTSILKSSIEGLLEDDETQYEALKTEIEGTDALPSSTRFTG